ncbi:hypothetical protein VB739_03375 [Cyanobium gracile UHCC 0281]|uniref:Uncharacterized protein n=1 Tax=Cyanobium gracile UHCC 0281 TaxID=3110309 RepID=A0ABU5ST35_9CYAN|nr:hypothetical protein [Cyanobium gracile UHCC 0281]
MLIQHLKLFHNPGTCSALAEMLQMIHFGAGWMDLRLRQIRLHEQLLPSAERDPATTPG